MNRKSIVFFATLVAALTWSAAFPVIAQQDANSGPDAATKPSGSSSSRVLRVGSKAFTESVILGEMLRQLSEHAGAHAIHQSELGGTQFLWQALLKGDIDVYVEYSGTLKEEILAGKNADNLEVIRELLQEDGIAMTQPLGFNNTYAIGMRESRAEELGITSISDLRNFPQLEVGLSDEFLEREDGWAGLKNAYRLPYDSVRGLDHSLTYRGVAEGSIDLLDLYSTDPEIISYDLRVLADDLNYFPLYEAVVVYRSELLQSHPAVVKQFQRLEGLINNQQMSELNKQARVDRIPERQVAAQFLHREVDESIPVPELEEGFATIWKRFVVNTREHIVLVLVSLSMAIAISIPLGILAYKMPRWGEWILGLVGIIQTIPSLALLVFMIPLLGIGAKPAIVALFLYSLLPIVRGTHTGLTNLPDSIHESALALGLSEGARLRLIELPLASQSILSGIKTSAVINVGTATIGALIGAGGYGKPIISGIRLDDQGLILQGAIPAAALALIVQAAFSWAEVALVPAGLRLKSARHD